MEKEKNGFVMGAGGAIKALLTAWNIVRDARQFLAQAASGLSLFLPLHAV